MSKVQSPRTIGQLHAELKAADPNCALTITALRRLVRSGAIRSCRVGAKYLVTHEAVAEFLQGHAIVPIRIDGNGVRPFV